LETAKGCGSLYKGYLAHLALIIRTLIAPDMLLVPTRLVWRVHFKITNGSFPKPSMILAYSALRSSTFGDFHILGTVDCEAVLESTFYDPTCGGYSDMNRTIMGNNACSFAPHPCLPASRSVRPCLRHPHDGQCPSITYWPILQREHFLKTRPT
jgi:hypothetical protein